MMQSRSALQRVKGKYENNYDSNSEGLNECKISSSSSASWSLSDSPRSQEDEHDEIKKFHSYRRYFILLHRYFNNSYNTYNNDFYPKYWKEHPVGTGRVRRLILGFLFFSIVSIVLFHPPCKRRRARHSPVCVISRGLGFSEPLLPLTKNQRDAKQERSRLLLGILSVGNDPYEKERRRAIRIRLLNDPINAKRNMTCPLNEFLRFPKYNKRCQITYTFLLGGNDHGNHLTFNKTYNSQLPYNETTFFTERFRGLGNDHLESIHPLNGTEIQFEEPDVTFLNVRDVNDVRKVWAWYDYSTKLRVEKGRQFDYVGVMMATDSNTTSSSERRPAHYVLDPAIFLKKNSILRPKRSVPRTYAGVERSKEDCGGHNASWACTRLHPDTYMSGDLMVLSKDLVDYCLSHSNLIQLNGVYPQDRPDIALANLLSLHPQGVDTSPLVGIVYDEIESW